MNNYNCFLVKLDEDIQKLEKVSGIGSSLSAFLSALANILPDSLDLSVAMCLWMDNNIWEHG